MARKFIHLSIYLLSITLVIFVSRQGLFELIAVERLKEDVPPFELQTLDGGKIRSADLEGKVVVLDFWATWCGPCRQSFPKLEKVYQDYRDHPEVAFVAVNTSWNNSLEDVRRFAAANGYEIPFGYDAGARLTGALVTGGIPTYCILDREGRLRARHSGFLPIFEDYGRTLRRQVEKILAEEA